MPSCKSAVNYLMNFDYPAHSDYGPKCGRFLFTIKDAYWFSYNKTNIIDRVTIKQINHIT